MTYESRPAARECKWLLLFKIILKFSNSLCFPCVFPKFSNSCVFPVWNYFSQFSLFSLCSGNPEHGSCFVCLLCSRRKEGTTYICQLFCETANKPDDCLILWSERSLNPTDLLQDCLYPQPKTRKKVLQWQ